LLQARNILEFSSKKMSGLRNVWTMIRNRKRDRQTAESVQVTIRPSSIIIYYSLIEFMGLDQEYAHDLGLDKLYWLWHQYWSAADDILAEYGNRLSSDEIDLIIQQSKEGNTFPIISEDLLIRKGVSEDQLRAVSASSVFDTDERTKTTIVEQIEQRARHIIDAMGLRDSQKEGVAQAFVESSQLALESFVLERKIGLKPDSMSAHEYIAMKSGRFLGVLISKLYYAINGQVIPEEKLKLMEHFMILLQKIEGI